MYPALALVPRRDPADLYALVLCRAGKIASDQPPLVIRRRPILGFECIFQADDDHWTAGLLVDRRDRYLKHARGSDLLARTIHRRFDLFMGFFAQMRIIPVMTDVTHLLTSLTIVRTVIFGLIKPWGQPFKVTPKGLASDSIEVHWRILLPFAGMAVATALGMVMNISRYSPLYATDGYTVNVFWSIFNIAVLLIACAVCVELPKRRMHERFVSNETATLILSSGIKVPCVVRDISLSGAHLSLPIGNIRSDDHGLIEFKDGVEIPFEQVRQSANGLAVRFNTQTVTRQLLTAKLFTGMYQNEVAQIKLRGVLAAVGKRLAS